MFPNFTWILKKCAYLLYSYFQLQVLQNQPKFLLNQLVAQCSSFLLRFPLSAAKIQLFYPTVVAFQQMFSIGKHIFWFLKVAYWYDFRFNHLVMVTHFTGSLWQFIPQKLSHQVGNLFGMTWNQWKTPAGLFLQTNFFLFSQSKISESNKPFNLNLTSWFFVITAIEFYTSALVYMI